MSEQTPLQKEKVTISPQGGVRREMVDVTLPAPEVGLDQPKRSQGRLRRLGKALLNPVDWINREGAFAKKNRTSNKTITSPVSAEQKVSLSPTDTTEIEDIGQIGDETPPYLVQDSKKMGVDEWLAEYPSDDGQLGGSESSTSSDEKVDSAISSLSGGSGEAQVESGESESEKADTSTTGEQSQEAPETEAERNVGDVNSRELAWSAMRRRHRLQDSDRPESSENSQDCDHQPLTPTKVTNAIDKIDSAIQETAEDIRPQTKEGRQKVRRAGHVALGTAVALATSKGLDLSETVNSVATNGNIGVLTGSAIAAQRIGTEYPAGKKEKWSERDGFMQNRVKNSRQRRIKRAEKKLAKADQELEDLRRFERVELPPIQFEKRKHPRPAVDTRHMLQVRGPALERMLDAEAEYFRQRADAKRNGQNFRLEDFTSSATKELQFKRDQALAHYANVLKKINPNPPPAKPEHRINTRLEQIAAAQLRQIAAENLFAEGTPQSEINEKLDQDPSYLKYAGKLREIVLDPNPSRLEALESSLEAVRKRYNEMLRKIPEDKRQDFIPGNARWILWDILKQEHRQNEDSEYAKKHKFEDGKKRKLQGSVLLGNKREVQRMVDIIAWRQLGWEAHDIRHSSNVDLAWLESRLSPDAKQLLNKVGTNEEDQLTGAKYALLGQAIEQALRKN